MLKKWLILEYFEKTFQQKTFYHEINEKNFIVLKYPPGLVGKIAVIFHSMLISTGNMCHQSGKPVQSIKHFFEFPVFGGVNNLGNTIIRFFGRDINHSFLGHEVNL